ncbi:MAG: hypothetical protein DI591_13680, partial [Citromicrobium sp.]
WEALGQERPADPAALEEALRADEEAYRVLSEAREGDPGPLQRLSQALFGPVADDRQAMREPLTALEEILGELDVTATKVGSAGVVGDDSRFPLIFLDYYLGDKGIPSIVKSRNRIQEVTALYSADDRPIVVLMSSDLNNEKTARKFRDEAELLGCQFKFIPKQKFRDAKLELVSSLADLVSFLPQTRKVGQFVEAWTTALEAAKNDFVTGIRQLDLYDYFMIRDKLGQNASGRFGDHVSSLFDGYLRRLVEDRAELRLATASLNKVTFDDRPPAPFIPSEIVTRIADAMAFQSIDADQEKDSPLELGDVFIQERGRGGELRAAAVISQACDLEQNKTENLLLIRGTVTRRDGKKMSRNQSNQPILRTDLFRWDSKDFIIDWDASDLMTAPVLGIARWSDDNNFKRVARLRPMQALALQQLFANHLTRVGLPETPHPYRYPDIEIYRQDGNKKALLTPAIPKKNRQACIIGDEKKQVVIDERLLALIRTKLAEIEVKPADEEGLKAAREALDDFEKVQELRHGPLADGTLKVGNIVIRDSEAAMQNGDSLPKDCWLLVNLYG